MEPQSPGNSDDTSPAPRFPPGSPCGALVAASRELRRAVEDGAPVPAQDVASAVTASLRELYMAIADYDGSPLREQLEALRETDPRTAGEVDDRLEMLEIWLEPALRPGKPSLPEPDGTHRAARRSLRRLSGDPAGCR
jgi:hypothetical protein